MSFDIDKFDTPIGKKIPDELIFRVTRDELLKEADILINKAEDTGKDSIKLREYRQALRDATQSWVLPILDDYTVVLQ